jgi:transposase
LASIVEKVVNNIRSIGNLKDTALSNLFNHIAYRKGRHAAISATEMKLAIVIWNMIVRNVPYKPENNYEFLDQKRKRKVQEMKLLIHKFDIKINNLGLQT